MTWGEFKKMAEDRGATDDQQIWYIDVSFPTDRMHVAPEDKNNPKDIGLVITT